MDENLIEKWGKICRDMATYANKNTEMDYQRSIRDLVLDHGLCWKSSQIEEQKSIQIGSSERLIPDIIVSKDGLPSFVVEVKRADNIRTQNNIDQLVSYMQQLETPRGIYVGERIEVYYKTIGDGSEPIRVMSLQFKKNDQAGQDFVRLFSADAFSIEKIVSYINDCKAAKAFETHVHQLMENMVSDEFKIIMTELISDHYKTHKYTDEEINAAISNLNITITPISDNQQDRTHFETMPNTPSSYVTHACANRSQISARQYAYNLIKQIVEKNHSLTFRQLYDIFGRKNFIEDLNSIKDENRWYMGEDDILHSKDGISFVVSNQWGYYNNAKRKMDFLRSIAQEQGIDI